MSSKANQMAGQEHDRAKSRVANRMKRIAMTVYSWTTYPEDDVYAIEVPDELWDPSNPEQSAYGVHQAVDQQTGTEEYPVKLVKQVGQDWVVIGEFGRLESFTIMGPTAEKTARDLMNQYMSQYKGEESPMDIPLTDFI